MKSPICRVHGIAMTQDDPPLGATIQSWCQFACPATDCRSIVFLSGADLRRCLCLPPMQVYLPFEAIA